MQASNMGVAFHLLRSQSHLLNFSKIKFIPPQFSRHFLRPLHDETPVISHPPEPALDPTPKTWSASYSAPIKQFATDGEAEEAKKPILTEIPLNPQPAEPTLDPTPKAWSVFNCAPIRPIVSDGIAEEAEKPILTENPLNPQPAEPTLDPTPKTWPVFNSAPSRPIVNEGVAEEAKNWVNSGNVGFNRSSLGNGKRGKSKMHWVCSNCGHSEAQWWGSCRKCKDGTLQQFSVSEDVEGGGGKGFEASEKSMKSWLPDQKWSGPVRLSDVSRGMNHSDWRIYLPGTFGAEVARVLGGGVVPGSLILVGGDPGVGKSTLALQIAALIAESCDLGGAGPVVYISGEESIEQIGNRADRLSIGTEELFLYSGTDVEDILDKIQPLRPRAIVIDSIQTVYLKGVTGSPGGLMQLKECTSALLHFSKKTNVPVLLIGHVNKSGDIAGPRALEHIVDVVLYMEGEKHSSHRLLRSVKNRFGSADELGVFEMLESGLQAVSNPSEMFLSEEHADSDLLAGLAVAVIIDGSRAFLIEVQALCVPGTSVAKHVNGVQASRAEMIISVLKKQAGLKIEDSAVLLNVISGVKLAETAGDLAVAAAICSSSLEYPIPNNVAFIGEIGLAGELRMVPRIEKRVNTLAKLGYKMCVVPKSAEKTLAAVGHGGIEVVGCKNLKQVIDKVFVRK